jgi:hypothetical protein
MPRRFPRTAAHRSIAVNDDGLHKIEMQDETVGQARFPVHLRKVPQRAPEAGAELGVRVAGLTDELNGPPLGNDRKVVRTETRAVCRVPLSTRHWFCPRPDIRRQCKDVWKAARPAKAVSPARYVGKVSEPQ